MDSFDTFMNQVDTLLFDLDGTLVDSKECLISSAYETANIFAPGQYNYQDLEGQFGGVFAKYLIAIDYTKAEEIKKCYRDLKRSKYHDPEYVQVFPFVKEGLKKLKESGYKLSIVTNQVSDLTRELLKKEEMLYFDEIICGDEVNNHKPHPQPILKAMELLSSSPNTTLMVGDSEFDFLAAERAGVKSVQLDHYNLKQVNGALSTYSFDDFAAFVKKVPLCNKI